MVSKHCSIIRKHAKFEPDRTNRTGVMTKNVRSVRRRKKKERKKEEEQSYPLVSPPEVDLLVPITFRWIILVKIIKGYSRITETNIKCNGYR